MVLAAAPGVLTQTTSSNPLNQFISAAGSAFSVIESAAATETPAAASATATSSASSTTPSSSSATSTSQTSTTAAAATSSSAAVAAAGGLSTAARDGIIAAAVVVGLILLLALALCLFCCLRRRRHNRRVSSPVADDETTGWRKPVNPGRTYAPVNQTHPVPMSQQPSVPLMVAAGGPHPADHPAYRQDNPFVPVPPSPRKTGPNAGTGLTGVGGAGVPAFVDTPYNGQPLRNSRSIPRNSAGSGLNDGYSGNGPNGFRGEGGINPVIAAHSIHNNHNNYSAIGNGGTGNGGTGNGYNTARKPVPIAQKDPYRPPTPFGLNGLKSNPSNPDLSAHDEPLLAASTRNSIGNRSIPNSHEEPLLPVGTRNSTGNNNLSNTKDEPFLAAGAVNSMGTTNQGRNGRGSFGAANRAPNARDSFGAPSQGYVLPSGARGSQNPYHRIGSPYEDMHVHQLQSDGPSTDLIYTDIEHPAPVQPAPTQTSTSQNHPIPLQTYPAPEPAQTRQLAQRPGYSTPPLVPSRSPNRHSQFRDSTYESQPSYEESHSATGRSTSTESWATGPMQPPTQPWEDRERRYSGGSTGGRRYSGSPRRSSGGTPTNTTPRRLRYSDVQQEPDFEHRYSQGVGQAL